MEKLSVCVPIYNSLNTLERCVQSLIKQTYTNIEIVLVDDGSTDGSERYCDEISSMQKNIKVLHQSNAGMIMARYNGLKAATGTAIAFLDSDDFVECNMYEDLMKYRCQYDVEAVFSNYISYRSDTNKNYVSDCIDEGVYSREDIDKLIIPRMIWDKEKYGVNPSMCNKIFSKDILLDVYERLKKYRFDYGEDAAVVYPMLLNINSFYKTTRAYYYHTLRSDNQIPGYMRDRAFFHKLYDFYSYMQKCINGNASLLEQLDKLYVFSVKRKSVENGIYDMSFDYMYLFPFADVPQNAKLVIYGAGRMGKAFHRQLNITKYANIVLWVDEEYGVKRKMGLDVSPVASIDGACFDRIVIAVVNRDLQDVITKILVKKYNINSSMIVYPLNKNV